MANFSNKDKLTGLIIDRRYFCMDLYMSERPTFNLLLVFLKADL